MRVVVIGAGEVGFDVTRILAEEQHDVTVVDTNTEALQTVTDRLDVLTVRGSGTSASVLQDAGVAKADMLIAVTSIDEVNLVACMMADRMDVDTTIARVRSDELTRTKSVLKTSDFGIDLVIHLEESAAAEVSRLIRRASASDVLTFANERLHLVGMRLDEDAPVVGQSLRDISLGNADFVFRIMAIGRGMRTLLPRGGERLRAGDQVFVLTRPEYVPHVARAMGKNDAAMQHVMVLGGTPVGAMIALQLSQHKNKRVKLIEPSRERAENLAEGLKDVLVICGDATDIDLLAQEGLGEMDAFVAVTGDEESNLVTCLLAKHIGVRKTVALLSKGAYIPISQSIGLDAAVSKKLAVSREIRRFLRGKHVRSVATVHGLDAEILEIEAARGAPATRGPLTELDLPEGILIGAVERGDEAKVATGATEIQPGDRAIVFVLPSLVDKAEAFFDGRK